MKPYTQDEKGTTYNINTEDEVDRIITQNYKIMNGRFVGNPNIINLVIPENIEYVGAYAFKGCPNLWRVQIEGATIIFKDAFKGCTNLKIVSLSEDVKTIAKHAFAYTGLSSINIPKNTRIEEYAFEKSKLKYAFIPDVNNIEHGVFHDCEELSNVTILGGEVIRNWTFHGCRSLTNIKLPASITEIKDNAFTDTGLTRVEIPSTTIVGEWAFDPGVEIVRYSRTDEHLLSIMCRNFLNNKNYSNEEKQQAENLIARLINRENMYEHELFEDDIK
ncbi:MAG: leucine-rich repeat protein [Clostridia bacterium]|nr:leucine-rich repeat protein [Clostridia bacterium]